MYGVTLDFEACKADRTIVEKTAVCLMCNTATTIFCLSLCRHVFGAFSCNIHHEERYLKFTDISFENIDTAKKYRDNIDTFLRRYPSPSLCSVFLFSHCTSCAS